MKIILGTTAIVTIIAIGLLGITNAFSQGNGTGIIENDKIMSINTTLPTTIISNATLAFAQEGFQTEDLVNETIDLGNTSDSFVISNATLPINIMDKTILPIIQQNNNRL